MKALKSHEVNFYSKYIIDPEKIHRRNVLILYSIPVIAVVAGLAGTVINMAVRKSALEKEIEEQQFILSEPVLMEDYSNALAASSQLDVLDSEISGMELFGRIKDTYPIIGSDEVLKILECTLEGIHVTSISFEPVEGYIHVEAQSDDVTVIPQYVEELKKTGLLVSADYSGYSGSVKSNDIIIGDESIYTYHISVAMSVTPPETNFDFETMEFVDSDSSEEEN